VAIENNIFIFWMLISVFMWNNAAQTPQKLEWTNLPDLWG
jgi:hypothetical protein